MASGRVGGTRSKVSGQVGDKVYQIRRNNDGSYSQVIMAKGEYTVSETNPKLQAQRMVTAMVESMMKDLKEVARISMQSAPNKSKSLNAFSAFNIELVRQDMIANWYEDCRFNYPFRNPYKSYVQDLGGPYIISSGTLQWELFDGEISDDMPSVEYDTPYIGIQYLYGISLSCDIGTMTVGQFLAKHKMTRLDSIVLCGLDYYQHIEEDDAEPEDYLKHIYCIAQVNPRFSDGTVITPEVATQLFIFKQSGGYGVLVRRDGTGIVLGVLTDYFDNEEMLLYVSYFSISYLDGKKKISRSSYHNPDGMDKRWALDATPTYNFGSWMSQADIHNYPNPWGTDN